MFKQGSVKSRWGCCKFKQENQSKASEYHQNIIKLCKHPWLEMTKEGIVDLKNMQGNKMNISQHLA